MANVKIKLLVKLTESTIYSYRYKTVSVPVINYVTGPSLRNNKALRKHNLTK